MRTTRETAPSLPSRRSLRRRRRGLAWLAGLATASLVTGVITVVTFGTAPVSAAEIAPPTTTIGVDGTYIAGEDLAVTLTFTGNPDAGAQYNLSAGVVLPADVTVVSTGTLGTPRIFPTASATDRVIPGLYATVDGDCTVLGLEPVTGSGNFCAVPEGMQYLVFQNVSDLPAGASATHTLTLRPDAATFPVGTDRLQIHATAYTSSDERFIPLFPGSRGLALDDEATSRPGAAARTIEVQALRLEKSEPSPEEELLRGVHDHSTTYTLRVWHTGEGDIDGVTVTDFLPAGLEYLGLGGVDNTTDANGAGAGALEYPGADDLTGTPAPDASPLGGANATRNAAVGATTTVETVVPTAAEVAAYGLDAGKVYTKVTWNLGSLLAAGDATRDIRAPKAQQYASTAGEPGYLEIRYRAAVPLFENTLDFDGAGGQPATDGAQAANLDNNRGASTRHGSVQTTPGTADEGLPVRLVNVAGASGSYAGATADPADSETRDVASYGVDAVDVRVLKSVDDTEFRQGQLARYTLLVQTGEYTTAALGAGGSADIRPNRLVDDLADGICPVIPADAAVTPGASDVPGVPRLIIGDPRTGAVGPDLDAAAWTAELGSAQSSCGYPSADADADFAGATLTGIAFDPATGHFFLDLSIRALAASDEVRVEYTARQNSFYSRDQRAHGATTSGDAVVNHVDLMATTTSIPALDGVHSAGDAAHGIGGDVADGVWRAWDDSRATLEAELSTLSKHVLRRSAGAPDRDEISGMPEGDWVQTVEQNEPYAVGDQVWYRIVVSPPTGADVRNPLLTDFLPLGVAFDDTRITETDRPENIWVVPSSRVGLGDCTVDPDDPVDWLNTFVPYDQIVTRGNVIRFDLGSSECFDDGTSDRFLPLATDLEIYIRVTVVDPAAFATVDIPENLAKYQQNNVEGKIFFLRDAAAIEIDGAAGLTKGIRTNSNASSASGAGYDYRSDVDGTPTVETVQQGDEVTFRLDVAAPRTDTDHYEVWDALPAGLTKADLAGIQPDGTIAHSSATAAIVTQQLTAGVFSPVETPASGTWTAHAYDIGDAGYPAVTDAIADAGRTVIVWSYDGVVPGSLAADPVAHTPAAFQGLTLGYTVVIPDGTDGARAAQLTQRYENDASITAFSYVNNAVDTSTRVIVNGPEQVAAERTPAAGEYAMDDADGDASDPSRVYVVGATPTKRLVSTEIGGPAELGADRTVGENDIDDLNTQDRIVQGELATFEYAIEIPAATTVRNAVLSDNGDLGYGAVWGSSVAYEFVEARYFVDGVELDCTGTTDADFRCADTVGATHGVLTFPVDYTTHAAPVVVSVEITVWVDDADATTPTRTPDLGDSTPLRNTATFGFDDPNTADSRLSYPAHATATYVEPALAITKLADDDTDVTVGDPITYTLTVSNPGRVASYDNVVVDTVPYGLEVDLDSFTVNGVAIASSLLDLTGDVENGQGGTITWSFEDIPALAQLPDTVLLGYTASISPETGGGAAYTNTAVVTGQTLPADLDSTASARRGDRRATSSEVVTATTAAITKGVRVGDTGAYTGGVTAPIGETASYELEVTLRANINYYDVRIEDTLPAGVALQGTPEITSASPELAAANWTFQPATAPGTTWGFVYAKAGEDGDVDLAAQERTLTIRYDVLLANTVAATVHALPNTARLSWGSVNGADDDDRIDVDDAATVTVPDPQVALVKRVKATGAADTSYAATLGAEVDGAFTYRIRVTATAGTGADAYNIHVTDAVPAGVLIDTASFRIAGVAPAIAPTTSAGIATGAAGTVVWTIPGPLAPGASVDLTYDAHFVASGELHSGGKTNTARVTDYSSFPTGGRGYTGTGSSTATVTPRFPHVDLVKQVADTSRTAYVGEPFGWVLTATNTGTGPAQKVVLTDTLPANWTFTAVQSIMVAGAAVASTAPAGPAAGPLVWTFGQDAASGTPAAVLLPGQSIVIRYTATPSNPQALVTPGVGVAHTNRLSAVTTDRRNQVGNADDDYTGDDAHDDAFLRQADLHLVKQAVGGVTAVQNAADNPLRGLPIGTWVPGQQPLAGQYAQPQWRITVTNQGPDAGYGPFRITDVPDPVTGVAVTGWTARLYTSAGDTTGTLLALSGAGTPADPFVLGDTGTYLDAAGARSIVLTATVTITDAAADDALLHNAASVTGRTYEDPDDLGDNDDEDERPLARVADLQIEKTVSNLGTVTVGDTLTWGITVTNLGPSVSASATEKITVTDTVPAGVAGVADPSTTDWAASVTRGGAASSFPARAGDVITWTYRHDGLAVDVPTTFSLAGTVLTSHTGEIRNTAVVHPGDTDDPVTPNNTDDVPVTPDDGTWLSIQKTRVVWDATSSSWVAAAGLDPVPSVVPGAPVSYLVEVTNDGPADARDVQVVDEVPTGLSYSSHELTSAWTRTAGGSTSTAGTPQPGWDTFTLGGTLPAGETASFVVSYATSAELPTTALVNCVEVTSENWAEERVADFARDCDSNASSRVVDLGIVKSHTPAAGGGDVFVAGTDVSYRLVVTNHGPSVSDGPIVVTDELPAGMSYVVGSARVSVAGGAPAAVEPVLSGTDDRILSWSVAVTGLAVNATVVVTLDARIDPDVRAHVDLGNFAAVSGPHTEPPGDPHPNEDDDAITTTTSAVMTIVKDVDAGPWVAGTQVGYTLSVVNAGPSAAPATVVDTLPAGLTLVSMSGTGWTCPVVAGAQSGTCTYTANAGLLEPNASPVAGIRVVALISATVVAGTELDNEAVVTWTSEDGTDSDEDDEEITVTAVADLGVTKHVRPAAGSTAWIDAQDADAAGAVVAGATTEYRLQVSNAGPSDAVGPLVVTDALPAGASFVALGASPGWSAEADTAAGTVTFTRDASLGGLAFGAAPLEIVYTVLFDADLEVGEVLTNTAALDPATLDANDDPNTANDDDPAVVEVDREVDVAIVKSHVADAVRIGDELPFTLLVTNAGPSQATGVHVVDTLPAGLELLSVVGPVAGTGWEITSIVPVDVDDPAAGAMIEAEYADALEPGASADELTILTRVTVGAYPSVVNTAEVDVVETDVDPGDNTSDDTVDVPPMVTLVVTKTAVGPFQVGSDARYAITVENLGPTDDPGPITVTDVLPAGLTFVSSPDDGVAVSGGTVTWTVPGIALGETVELTLVVHVGEAAYSSVTNVVDVASESELTPDSVTEAEADAEVAAAPLPGTGAEVSGLLMLALLLLVAGTATLVVTRRRRLS